MTDDITPDQENLDRADRVAALIILTVFGSIEVTREYIESPMADAVIENMRQAMLADAQTAQEMRDAEEVTQALNPAIRRLVGLAPSTDTE